MPTSTPLRSLGPGLGHPWDQPQMLVDLPLIGVHRARLDLGDRHRPPRCPVTPSTSD